MARSSCNLWLLPRDTPLVMGHRSISALAQALLLSAGRLAVGPARAATVIESRVAASADDAEENASGTVSIVGSDLELGWDGNAQTLGMRFAGLAIPDDASILEAWIQFETDEASTTAVTVTFQAQAADSAPSFSTSTDDLSSRPRATPTVAWTPPGWTTVGSAGPEQRSPDLSALVQAVVDRPGWSSGNALVIFVIGDSGTGRRIARSWNSDPADAPLLHVVYDQVAANDPPSLAIVSPLPKTQFRAGVPADLVATASDPEQGNLGAAVRWSSNRDGFLGMGAHLSRTLSTGIHTLTAQVQDAQGLAASASAQVQVTADGLTLLVAGDISSCSSEGDELTADLLDQRFGLIQALGDNAYPDGTLAQYQNCYGPSWGRHKARTRPAVGNHEYHVDGAAGYFAYFGAAAGDPMLGWYSYDIGSWHVVVLNSNCGEIGGCTAASPQGLWLEADLAANPRDCTIAVTHHPRFSSGSAHGSSTALRDLYDIFDRHDGDIFLSGHDHNYERFNPQDALGNADLRAPRQFVVGTGGTSLREMGTIEPNSATSAGDMVGVLALTLHEGSYDWEFLPAAGFTYTDRGSTSCIVEGGPPDNSAPSVSIQAPASGTSYRIGTPITFDATAGDIEDGSLDAFISWRSNRDGVLGSGPSLTTSALSVGTHGITASVQDSGGLPASRFITLNVTQPSTVTIEKRIAAGSDDAEEAISSNDVSLASPDLELIDDGADQVVGMRFAALEIPRNARVADAWLQFQADGSTSAATTLSIRAEASDDAPTFARTTANVSGRPPGSASVSWTPPSWATGAQGPAQRSPSLVSVVQQVVDRAGWASGNDLVLVVSGSGVRRAESFDGITAAAALLHVEYEVPGSGGGGAGP